MPPYHSINHFGALQEIQVMVPFRRCICQIRLLPSRTGNRLHICRQADTVSAGLASLPLSISWYVCSRLDYKFYTTQKQFQVVGGQGTGKTSLLRLLLETADISPTATVDQRAAVDRFLRGATKHTQSIQTACVEICESRFDRVLFSVIDTPGLDFLEGRELKLERQVNGIIKYVDAQYADTMSEVSLSIAIMGEKSLSCILGIQSHP